MVKFSPVIECSKGKVVYEKASEIVQDSSTGDFRSETWYRKCNVISTDGDLVKVKRGSRTIHVNRKDLCEII